MIRSDPGQIQISVQRKRGKPLLVNRTMSKHLLYLKHFATVVMACDLKPPVVHNGILPEGERSLFASESSLRAATLQRGSRLPVEYFAL